MIFLAENGAVSSLAHVKEAQGESFVQDILRLF